MLLWKSLTVFTLVGGLSQPLWAVVHTVKAISFVRQVSYQYQQQYAGRIRSQHITDVGFELDSGRTGTLEKINVDVGDTFKKGQILATLDTKLQNQRLLQLKAKLKEAEANLALAVSDSNRIKALRKRDYASKQVLDQALTKQESFKWQITALKAQLELATIQLKKLEIIAPFDGMVAQRYLSIGALVRSGEKVFQIFDTTTYQVNIGVPVRYLSHLKSGQKVKIRVDGRPIAGKIKSISSSRDPRTQSHNVLVTTTSKKDLFIPNRALASIDLTVTIPRQGAWVPLTALQQNYRGLWSIYALKPLANGKYAVVSHHAKIYFADKSSAYVESDLEDKHLIIADGLLRVVPGEKVAIDKGIRHGKD